MSTTLALGCPRGARAVPRLLRIALGSLRSENNASAFPDARPRALSCRRLGLDGGRGVVCPTIGRPSSSLATQTDNGGNKPFPSLVISADGITAQGPFAETQATFMRPDPGAVSELDGALKEKNMGVVAHYYMDAELQGTLSALSWPHVVVADSLAMGEAAVRMAERGVSSVACLGVDFMAESVRATLDANGFQGVPVYRLAEEEIGCSLAESAERREYEAWLRKASKTPRSLHVVYINTSLITKAMSQAHVPTITCTSSNVLNTVLQAFVQVRDLTVWYGPDTYMGENLKDMLRRISELPDEEIRALHPGHDQASMKSLLPRFHYFLQGNCIVHHMFGDKVVDQVRSRYGDAYHTAHLEVPGEMFQLAMDAQQKGRGVVGSTSNILGFIKDKTREACSEAKSRKRRGLPLSPSSEEEEGGGKTSGPQGLQGGGQGEGEKLQFVLGTESGMITSIVRAVQTELRSGPAEGTGTKVEIVFPVASEAMSATGEDSGGDGDLRVVPGVSGGEGCSTAGGCATCPFMKMNHLDALMDVVEGSNATSSVPRSLSSFLPKKRTFNLDGRDETSLGVLPILHMRSLMKAGQLSNELVEDIISRSPRQGQ